MRRFRRKILTHNILADTDCEVELIFTEICKSVNEKQLESTNVVLGQTGYYTLTQLRLYPSQSFSLEIRLHGFFAYCVFTDYRLSWWFKVDVDSVFEYLHRVDVQCY
jgi:hypothetical protein